MVFSLQYNYCSEKKNVIIANLFEFLLSVKMSVARVRLFAILWTGL